MPGVFLSVVALVIASIEGSGAYVRFIRFLKLHILYPGCYRQQVIHIGYLLLHCLHFPVYCRLRSAPYRNKVRLLSLFYP